MQHPLVRSLALLLSLLVLPSGAGAQSDEERARARTEFARGVSAFEAHDYTGALEAFQEAYRLAPHASVRLNIAHCYQELDRPVEAVFHFEHYLTEASGLTGAQRREIEGTLRELRGRVGTLTLQITPDGATIVIDDSETRRAPVSEPVRVTAGDHTVVISLDGYATERQTVHVEGGGDARVAIRLRRASAVAASPGSTSTAAAVTTTEPAPSPPSSTAASEPTPTPALAATEPAPEEGGASSEPAPSAPAATEPAATEPAASEEGGADGASGDGGGLRFTLPVFIAGGATLAAAAAWGITGGLALGENSAFESDVARANDTSLSEEAREAARVSGRGHADSARTLAVTSDILLVTTLVGVGTTTFFFVLAQTEPDESDEVRAMVVPVVTASPDGALFLGASAAGSF